MKSLCNSLFGALCLYIAVPCYRFLVTLRERLGITMTKQKISRRDKKIMAENYEFNRSSDLNPSISTKNRLINDQNGKTGKSFRYGEFFADYNACEAIAIHNTLVILGFDSALSKIIKAVQSCGGMFCRGKWGTKLSYIGKIIEKEYGLPSRTIRKISDINNNGIYIISFWNDPKNLMNGIHTVALRLENGLAGVYNCSSNRTESLSEVDLRQKFGGGFIIGYFFMTTQAKPLNRSHTP